MADEAAEPFPWLVLSAMGASVLLTAIGTGSVSTVLPVIQRDLGTDVATVGLVVTVYQVAIGSLLLTFGRLGDLRGHRAIWSLGAVLFAGGSAICGVAPNVALLVAARAVQAIGGAMIFATNVAIVTEAVPGRYLGRAMGVVGLGTYAGLSAGPIVAGWLTELISWRAVFLMNVPLGIAMLAIVLRFVPVVPPVTPHARFDVAGALLFGVALGGVIFDVEEGPVWGWTSPPSVALALVAVAALAAFIALEARTASPMVDLSLFRSRSFSAAAASAVLNYVGTSAATFLVPFYLIHGRGLSPSQAGTFLSSQPIAQVLAAPTSGTLSDRLGARWLSTGGMVAMVVGLLALSRLDAGSGLGGMTAGLVLLGLGTGTFVSPNSSAMMSAAPAERRGTASGIQATCRYIGFALGTSIGAAAVASVTDAAGDGLFRAIAVGFVVAAFFVAIGVATSAVRSR